MNRGRSFFGALLGANFLLVTLSMFAFGWYASKALRESEIRSVQKNLREQMSYLAYRVGLAGSDSALILELSDYNKFVGTRITWIDSSGRVLWESARPVPTKENYRFRPEFLEAAKRGEGRSVRWSATMEKYMVYYAKILLDRGQLLRLSHPVSSIEESVSNIRQSWLWGGGIILALAALLTVWVSRWVVYPLRVLREGAERFTQGKLDRRLPLFPWREVRSLADAMNRMARQLDERIRSAVYQKNETEAILSSMMEGVVAVDHRANILRCNEAFLNLFGLVRTPVVGRALVEVVRHGALEELLQEFHQGLQTVVRDIMVLQDTSSPKTLQVRGSLLRDAAGKQMGSLIVFNDVTRLRQLEDIRKDFVANVSHELKTPITSIKGFVETLEGLPELAAGDSRRFLEIIARHADRMNSIIDDLLMLSRLEHGHTSQEMQFEEVAPADMLESVVQQCMATAEKKKISLVVQEETNLIINCNPGLLEQAIVNLVANAIKYSDTGKSVELRAWDNSGQEIRISVRDHGSGIEGRHLPRIFERFYRVDKARSRSLGGTGLGLSITKHIMMLHGGYIEVESELGTGSLFTLVIPTPSPNQILTIP